MDLFKHTLYINLEHRIDRNERVLKEFEKLGIQTYERFPAIKTTNGSIGCTLSHIKCVELAKSRGYEHVFICEDDITFTNPTLFINNATKFAQLKMEWDVIIVGGNNCPPYQPINDVCIRTFNIQTTTGYIVQQRYYDILIHNFKEGLGKLIREPNKKNQFAIDIYWKSLQQSGVWVMIIPPTVTQYSDYSDIEDRVVDYGTMMLDLDKKALMDYYKRLNEEEKKRKLSMKL